eukprot:750924-Hanusia_phi.AAC.2
MTDEGGKSFTSALLSNPFIKEIDISMNNVSARTARHLREILAMRNSGSSNISQRSTEWIVQEAPKGSSQTPVSPDPELEDSLDSLEEVIRMLMECLDLRQQQKSSPHMMLHKNTEISSLSGMQEQDRTGNSGDEDDLNDLENISSIHESENSLEEDSKHFETKNAPTGIKGSEKLHNMENINEQENHHKRTSPYNSPPPPPPPPPPQPSSLPPSSPDSCPPQTCHSKHEMKVHHPMVASGLKKNNQKKKVPRKPREIEIEQNSGHLSESGTQHPNCFQSKGMS